MRGKVVLKIFGTDLDGDARRRSSRRKRALAKVPGIVDLDLYRDATVPQLQIELDREALARAGIAVDDGAATSIETALAGKVVDHLWENERPVPVRADAARSRARDDESAIGDARRAAAERRQRAAARARADRGRARRRATSTARRNSRFLALKFNVEGRDMGSVVERRASRSSRDEVKLPDGHYFVWGGEFENQQRAMARLEVIVPISLLRRARAAVQRARLGRAARSRCC